MMKKRIAWMVLTMVVVLSVGAQTTLDECQRAAEQNYPLIRRYALLEQTTAVTVANISKNWLPQVTASAQATWQNRVVSLPDALTGVMTQQGAAPQGLKKEQYRVGVDVQQMVFDGGAVYHQKVIAREQGAVQAAQNEVDLYAVRQRVNELYFSLLLLEDQLKLNADLQTLLSQNEAKLASMFKHGTAAESDYNAVRAERLEAVQQQTQLMAQQTAVHRVLELFCGIELNGVVKPEPLVASGIVARPELRLFDAHLRLTDAQERSLTADLLPKLNVFASGYYGYPGYDMFHDIMSHDWTVNAMVGARLSWNIGALYTRKNDRRKLNLQRQLTENQRELFLFNTRMEQVQQQENILRYQRMMYDDAEIIRLRSAVRVSAESKLAHGIIDVSELVRQIQQENNAKTQQSIHEIEMLKEMYHQKYTENN